MSGFGALCPLPLRLGGDAETGLSASQYCRIAADVLACLQTSPFAAFRVTSAVMTAYRGWNGCGLAHAPTIALVTGSTYSYTWPETWEDDAGVEHAVNIQSVRVTPMSSVLVTARVEITAPNQIQITGAPTCCVTVWGGGLERTLSDYGAYADKDDSKTEVVPYAWSAYRALQDARGSAYTQSSSGLVHIENLVLARGHAARWRDGERVACNANPATASEMLPDWQTVLGVAPRAGDTTEDIRSRCAAKFAFTLGPTRQVVDDAIAALLGRFFVKVWREHSEDLSSPPALTYWPGENPGPAAYDLGGGAWLSERSRIFVEVTPIADADQVQFNSRIDALQEMLDLSLPAWETWSWGSNADGGFVLDEDLLDEGTMGP